MTPAQDLTRMVSDWGLPLIKAKSPITLGLLCHLDTILDYWALKWGYPRNQVQTRVEPGKGNIRVIFDNPNDPYLHTESHQ